MDANDIVNAIPAELVKEVYSDAVADTLKEVSKIGVDFVKTVRLALFPVQYGAMLQDRIDTENGELSLSDDQPLYRVPYHPSADGNTVEIGVEQAAFGQNSSDFNTSLTFINMQLRGLAKAINGQ